MGLDMYLYCNSRTLTQKVHDGEPYGEYITEYYKSRGIVMYWRKANAIHKWFVDNVQNGEDDCGLYEVEWEQLVELRDICKRIVDECPLRDGKVRNGETFKDGEWRVNVEDGKVMTNVSLAEELLPTQSGFFFGGCDYDQWYYEDAKRTVDEIDRIGSMLDERKLGFWTEKVLPEEPDWCVKFQYHSSW